MDPQSFYDAHAMEHSQENELDKLPNSFNAALDGFVEAIPRYTPRILDAGCGDGRDSDYFRNTANADVVGVDISRDMLESNSGEVAQMDISKLGFTRNCFDGYWCPATIYFLPPEGVVSALEEARRVLAPDGVVHLGFKLGDDEIRTMDKWGDEVEFYAYTEESVKGFVGEAGFDIVSESKTSPDHRVFYNIVLKPKGKESPEMGACQI